MSSPMGSPKMEAHYTVTSAAQRRIHGADKRGSLRFAVTVLGQRQWGTEVVFVTGKREARQVAEDRNSTPWNF